MKVRQRQQRRVVAAGPRRHRRAAAATSSALCLLSSSSSILSCHQIIIHPALAFQPPLTRITGRCLHDQDAAPLPTLSYLSSASSLRLRSSLAIQMATPLDQQNDTSSPRSAEDMESSTSSPNNGSSSSTPFFMSPIEIETTTTTSSSLADESDESQQPKQPKGLLQKLADKVGKIDESRLTATPEYTNGEVPKLFSNLHYSTIEQPNEYGNGTKTITTVTAKDADTNFLSSSALLCGTALGCGILTLPSAVSSAGYLPSIIATFVAWGYMTISALLTSELLINRCGETGRVRNVGLLELYTSYLGEFGGKMAGLGFLIVSYVVMGVYLSEGGDMLMRLLENSATGGNAVFGDGGTMLSSSSMSSTFFVGGDYLSSSLSIFDNHSFIARTIFATVMGIFLLGAAKLNTVQQTVTHLFVPMTLLAFIVAMFIGLPTADFGALIAAENQHPEVVLNAFPLLFMGWTYHGVVPRVVYDLEGDKNKITKAIIVGSTTALVIYLTWNAMILGNLLGSGDIGVGSIIGGATDAVAGSATGLVTAIGESSAVVLGDMIGVDGADGSLAAAAAAASPSTPIDTLHFEPLLQSSIAIVSELAVITSLIGVVLGFVNEFNDAVGALPSKSYGPKEDNKWIVALLTLLPPGFVSIGLGYYSCADCHGVHIDNYEIIDYTGIFGSSIIFLILPALMAWQNRYGEEDPPRPLTVRPMVPLGKIPLSGLYKAAGTLIVEQGLEKVGFFAFVKEHLFFLNSAGGT